MIIALIKNFKFSKQLTKEVSVLIIFSIIIGFFQFWYLKTSLNFGFSPDDVGLSSNYIALGKNPFSKFQQEWIARGGPHIVNPEYYVGILFSFFGFDYRSYHVATLFFKIFSVISFYLLIRIISKSFLISSLSALIYSFIFGSAGSLEMVARGQDYLVTTGLNIFFILLYLIETKNLKGIKWLIISSVLLFVSFFINPIRAYPVLPFIFFIELFIFLNNKSCLNFFASIKKIFILFLPYLLISIIENGSTGISYGTLLDIMKRTYWGNLQLLLTPITTLGSLVFSGSSLKFLGISIWGFSNYISYLLESPSIIFFLTTAILAKAISKKPMKFFLSVFMTNFLFEFLLFFFIDAGLGFIKLPFEKQMNYDISYVPPTILGIYLLVLTFFIFMEWIKNKMNIFFCLYLLGFFFAVIFIIFTWIFQDIFYIPLGINGYSTLPSMGISLSLGSLLALMYTNIKSRKNLYKQIAPLIFLLLIPYYFSSNSLVQGYLNNNIKNGMNSADQIRLKDKFWSMVNEPESCNKFFFLDSRNDYDNGYFYSFILLDRFQSWYSLYSPYHSRKPCPVAFIISDEQKLAKSYTVKNGQLGFIAKNSDYEEVFSNLDNFYAFRFHDRDVFNIKDEVLAKLEK